WDPEPARYQRPVRAADVFPRRDRQGTTGAGLLGACVGGRIALQMLAMRPDLVKGLVLNDIGAVIEAAGLARIQDYMGKAPVPVTSWGEAARQTRAVNGLAFPDYGDDDWLRFARRLYRENSEGQPVIAFDPAIAPAPTPGAVRAVDMWAFY